MASNKEVKIKISVDDNDVQIVNGELLNFRQQVKLLKNELATLSAAGKENSKEFQIVARRLGETQDSMKRVDARSKDLFGSLSMLPGPIGMLFSELSNTIELLKVFSKFTFADLKFQLGEVADDFKDIAGGVQEVKTTATVGKTVTGVAGGGADVAGAAAATVQAAQATKQATDAEKGLIDAKTLDTTVTAANTVAQVNNTKATVTNTEATGANLAVLKAEEAAIVTSLTVQEEQLVAKLAYMDVLALELDSIKGSMRATVLDTEGRGISSDAVLAQAAAIRTKIAATNAEIEQQFVAIGTTEAELVAKQALIATEIESNAVKKQSIITQIAQVAWFKITTAVVTAYNTVVKKLTQAVQIYTITTTAAAEASSFFAVAIGLIEGAVVALGTVLTAGLILAVAAAAAALYKYVKVLLNVQEETEKNIGATDSYALRIKSLKEDIDLLTQAIDAQMKLDATRAKTAGKTEEQILQITKAANKEKLQALKDYDKQLLESLSNAEKDRVMNAEQRQKTVEEINAKIVENGRAINKQIMDNEQATEDGKLLITQKYINLRAKANDAAIELEIMKDKTSGEELKRLLEERLQFILDNEATFGKLSNKEKELIRKQNTLKVQAALDEDTKRVMDYNAKIADITIAGIRNEESRALTARQNKYKLDVANMKMDLEFRKKDATEQAAVLKGMEKQFNFEMDVIREQFYLKKFDRDNAAYERERGALTVAIENKHKLRQQEMMMDAQFDFDHYQILFGNLQEYLSERAVDLQAAWQSEHDMLNEKYYNDLVLLDNKHIKEELSDENYATKRLEIQQKIAENDQRQLEREMMISDMKIELKRREADVLFRIGDNLVSLLSALGEKSVGLAKAAAIAEAIVGIARIITTTQVAIAEYSLMALTAFGPIAGPPIAAAYAIKEKVAAGIGIAAITVGAINKINGISAPKSEAKSSSLGKNYGDGGMISGPLHSSGGVPIVAEGGEAVMTRGAVTMFRPLLSAMNQMGGGTSFSQGAVGQANYDNPQTNVGTGEPQIIKTYVVESEMSSTQHRIARLKDLSTL